MFHVLSLSRANCYGVPMARKASADSEAAHGFNDIVGIVLVAFALLLLAALLSYDARDVSASHTPPNLSARNWIGPFGAWMVYYWVFWVGAAVYEMPAILLFLGLGCFFEFFAYLRRRWLWTVVLFVCCIGLFDLYNDHLSTLQRNLHTRSLGGIIGVNLHEYFFKYFGIPGATIIFLVLAFISVLLLTNFQFGQ